jgi:hypothetical protein
LRFAERPYSSRSFLFFLDRVFRSNPRIETATEGECPISLVIQDLRHPGA